MSREAERRVVGADAAIEAAELLVRAAEVDLEVARDPTLRDVAETELQAAMQLQDEVAVRAASVVGRQLRPPGPEALWREWQAEPARFVRRSAMSARIKAYVIGKYGRKPYEAIPLERERQRLFDEMVATRAALVAAEQVRASGAKPKRLSMSAKQKSQFIRANGIEAYNRLDW